MTRFSWSDNIVIFLIEKVHATDYIWNSENVFHKNQLKRKQFWLQTAKDLNKEFRPVVPATYVEIIKKWNNLKSYFTVEQHKLYEAEKGGASAEELENIESRWKFKPNLNFLSIVVDPTLSIKKHKKRRPSLKESSSEGNLSEVAEDSTQANQRTQTSITELTSSPELQTKTTENSAFGIYISTEIDKLPPDLQISAKKEIFSIIMDLQSERIKRSET